MIRFQRKQITSAIFDMDGTLFDTERLRFQTLTQAALELFGKPFSEDVLLGSLGLSAKRAEALAKQHYGDSFPYAQIRERADELELEHVRTQGVPIKAGLLGVLERLRRSGLTMAVATSSRRVIAEEYLINANIFKYFDITVCGDEVEQGKPHPEIFLKAAQELNTPPHECLMFEDSENGLKSAHAAGGIPILIEDIKPPAPEIAQKAQAYYHSMQEFLDELIGCTPKLGMPRVLDPFPQAVNESKVGIHGFGAMGGGYLAQVLSHWDGYTRPCQIIASTGNPLLREAVESFGKYSIRYNSLSFDQSIEQIRLIDAHDPAAMQDMYVQCDLIALCLPEQAVATQAPIIAQSLLNRLEQHGRELTLLIVLNKVGAAEFVREQVEEALKNCTSAQKVRRILERTVFSETVVSRIVSKLDDEALCRQLRIKHELFEINKAQQEQETTESTPADLTETLPKEQIAEIEPIVSQLKEAALPASALSALHLVLFQSETDMRLYAQKGSQLLEQLRQVRTVQDISQIQTIKNRLWNGTHAILAWYADLLGYPTIGQAMGDERITKLLDQVIHQEIAPALLKTHPDTADIVPGFIETFYERCCASFKDPCARVGRDPLRKLQANERIFGSIQLANEQDIKTPGLILGASLGIMFGLSPHNAGDAECAALQAQYAEHQSITRLLTQAHSSEGGTYTPLDPEQHAPMLQAVAQCCSALSQTPAQDWDVAQLLKQLMPFC